jgi:hypothetical protein
LEYFLHNHDDIRKNRVRDLPKHETENELFLIGQNLTYAIVIHIIEQNIKRFNNTTTIDEFEPIMRNVLNEFLNNNNNTDMNSNHLPILQSLQQTVSEIKNVVVSLNRKVETIEKTIEQLNTNVNKSQTRTTTNFNEPLPTLGPRLQKINPATLELVQVYESVSECMRENAIIKRPSINKAIVESTIYCGFRWLLVERNLDPNIIHSIQPTKITRIQNIGYIAKLNSEKSEIIQIYIDRKTAAKMNGYPSDASLDNIVKNKTVSKGFYYVLYDECSDELREKYVEPLLYKNGVGKYDSDNNLIKEYTSKYECIKNDKDVGEKTLRKALEENKMYNGFYYRFLAPKLSC